MECRSKDKLITDHLWMIDWALGSSRGDPDARQSVMLGLCEAAQKFKPELGFAFSTYAMFWIKRETSRYWAGNKKWGKHNLQDSVEVAGNQNYFAALEILIDIKKLVTPRTWVLLRLKYGRGYTESQIAGLMKCTRQRVNQILLAGIREIQTRV